jgi:GntR family transcriptional repressor for pyruvate dehydrogenase complex
LSSTNTRAIDLDNRASQVYNSKGSGQNPSGGLTNITYWRDFGGIRTVPLQLITKEKLYVQIIKQILQMIREDDYQVGQRLPSERDLANQLGVSRPSVREAIAGLEVLGIVETRIGSGIVVRDLPPMERDRASTAFAELEFAHDESPYEIVAVRDILETGAIRLAVERATEKDLEDIRVALEAMISAAQSSGQYDIQVDFNFHLAVVRASHNTLLIRIMESLGELVNQRLYCAMIDLLRRDPVRAAIQTEDHRLIYEAVKTRDVDKAVASIRRHSDHWSLPELEDVPPPQA